MTPARPTDDLVAESLSAAWRAVRVHGLRLASWRALTFPFEALAFVVWAVAIMSLIGNPLDGVPHDSASRTAGLPRAVLMFAALAAAGAVLWVAAHVARGVFAWRVLGAADGGERRLGPWLRRRWAALLGWGALDLGVIAALLVLTNAVLTAAYMIAMRTWAGPLPRVATATGVVGGQPAPWGWAIGLSVGTTLVTGPIVVLLLLAAGWVWAGLRLVPWRLADDSASLFSAVAESWRWTAGRRQAWWAASFGWLYMTAPANVVPVLGWLFSSLLGWTWSAAFYGRLRDAQGDPRGDAPSDAPDVASRDAPGNEPVDARRGERTTPTRAPLRRHPYAAFLLRLELATAATAVSGILVLVVGTAGLVTAAEQSDWTPFVMALPFVPYAAVAVVGFAACLVVASVLLRGNATWPGRHGWSRSGLVNGLVALGILLSFGRGAWAFGQGIRGGLTFARTYDAARHAALALPRGFGAPQRGVEDPQLQPLIASFADAHEHVTFAADDADGTHFGFAYVVFESSEAAASSLAGMDEGEGDAGGAGGEPADKGSTATGGDRVRYARDGWAYDAARVGGVVIVGVAPEGRGERLGEAVGSVEGGVDSNGR